MNTHILLNDHVPRERVTGSLTFDGGATEDPTRIGVRLLTVLTESQAAPVKVIGDSSSVPDWTIPPRGGLESSIDAGGGVGSGSSGEDGESSEQPKSETARGSQTREEKRESIGEN